MKRRSLSPRSYILLYFGMALCLAGIVVFAWLLITNDKEYARGDAVYDHIRSVVFATTTAPDSEGDDVSSGFGESGSADPGGLIPRPSALDFRDLRTLNTDVVGWIKGGEIIDYPVAQGRDNDYYLDHLVTREQNKLGTVFMDVHNKRDFSDASTVLYGHNMKDGSMFASLTKYKKQEYFDRFPTMVLFTPWGDYTVELFAGVVADGDEDSSCRVPTDKEEFDPWLRDLRQESTFASGLAVQVTDRILVLCTCSYEKKNARYALFGRLVPADFTDGGLEDAD